MKQTRRKELKTNELSAYLQQIYQSAGRHSNLIIGGVVVVVLILVAGLLVQRNRHVARQTAWNTYYSIRDRSAVVTPELIEEARQLAEDSRNLGDLGPRAMELHADLNYSLAMSLQGEPDRTKQLFKEAKGIYEQALALFGAQPGVAARVRMGLAPVEESLLVAGEGDVERIRKLYQQVIDDEVTGFGADAREQLATLDERLAHLEIVATRPADAAAAQATTPPPAAALPQPVVLEAPTPAAPEQATPVTEEPPATAAPATTEASPVTTPATPPPG